MDRAETMATFLRDFNLDAIMDDVLEKYEIESCFSIAIKADEDAYVDIDVSVEDYEYYTEDSNVIILDFECIEVDGYDLEKEIKSAIIEEAAYVLANLVLN